MTAVWGCKLYVHMPQATGAKRQSHGAGSVVHVCMLPLMLGWPRELRARILPQAAALAE